MTRFESRNVSQAEVPASQSSIWALLTDADELAELTPLLDHIVVDGDHWTWQLSGISGLGLQVAPSFTVEMTFEPERRITYRHDPLPDTVDRAGANGVYELTPTSPNSTRLFIDLTLHVDLPLPRVSRRAVEKIMAKSMDRTGMTFARRMYARLGLDPALAAVPTPVDVSA